VMVVTRDGEAERKDLVARMHRQKARPKPTAKEVAIPRQKSEIQIPGHCGVDWILSRWSTIVD